MRLSREDTERLRALAREYAALATLPEQAERARGWRHFHQLRSSRPMVLIDQMPWPELNDDGGLELMLEDSYWRGAERWLLHEIYKWKRLSTDMVLDPYIKLPLPYHSTGWGIDYKFTNIASHDTSDITSKTIENQIRDMDDIEKIRTPKITVDEDEIEAIKDTADEVFSGILPWRFTGVVMHLGAWDTIAFWMGVENCYIELMDRPEMMHALMEKITSGYIRQIEQMNKLRLFDYSEHYCHCSHTYRDDDAPSGGLSSDAWAFGLAQLFTAVSPRVTDEFECAYMKRVFPYFKHIYYGCCDRLDDRMELVSALPNVRKLSCSPWSNREAFAEKLPAHIIMSNKPNPALLAAETFDEDAVRADLRRTIEAARRYNKSLEIIFKDISTVRSQPARLWRLSEIAMEEAAR